MGPDKQMVPDLCIGLLSIIGTDDWLGGWAEATNNKTNRYSIISAVAYQGTCGWGELSELSIATLRS